MSQSLLQQVWHHFDTIVKSIDHSQTYDHSLKMNQDLFQTYFNMSMGIASELNYLEAKDDELEQILQRQIEDGDVAARNRRRKGSQQQKVMEVNNSETRKLIDGLTKLKSKISTLNKHIEDILAFNA